MLIQYWACFRYCWTLVGDFIYSGIKSPLPPASHCSTGYLNAQRCPLGGSSYPARLSLFFHHLRSLLPWQPDGCVSLSLSPSLSLSAHWDLCSCLRAAEEGLTEDAQRKTRPTCAPLGFKREHKYKITLHKLLTWRSNGSGAPRSLKLRKWTKELLQWLEKKLTTVSNKHRCCYCVSVAQLPLQQQWEKKSLDTVRILLNPNNVIRNLFVVHCW